MGDLISRQAAIDAINKAFERVFAWDGTSPLGDKVLENVPSAQPERTCVNCGRTANNGGIEGAWNYCSVCGEQAIDLYDFCPNCGADMRGDDA